MPMSPISMLATSSSGTQWRRRAGRYSKLRFKLINNGSQSVHLLGIETDIAEDAKLFAHLGAEDWATLVDQRSFGRAPRTPAPTG